MATYDRRNVLRLVGMSGATTVLAGACGGLSRSSGKPGAGGAVKIGLIVPESGVYKVFGEDLRNGWNLFLKLNGGKLGGRDAEVITADEGDGRSPRTTVESAKRLINRDRVHVACGVVNSANLLAIQGLFTDARIPFVSIIASPAAVQGQAYGWRTSWLTSHPALAIGGYVASRAGGPVSTIVADYVAGHELLKGFRKSFMPAGGSLAGDPIMVPFPIGERSFRPYLQQIEQQNPKAVFAFFAGTDAVKFVKQYDEFGLADKYQLYAPGFLTEGYLLDAQGDAARGILNSLNYAPDLDNATNRIFVSEFQKRYGSSPTCVSVAAYDAGWVLNRAVEACKHDIRPERIEKEIGNLGEIDSPRGPWIFGKNRSPVQRWYLREVEEDGLVLSNVVIDELATLGDEA